MAIVSSETFADSCVQALLTDMCRAPCILLNLLFHLAGGGAGWPKFNQLEMVTTFTYKPNLVRIDARNFELSW